MYDLLDGIRGYATRDLVPDWTKESFRAKRKDAMGAARSILEDVSELQRLIDRLQRKVQRFGDDFEYNPTLMADIFDADFGPPSEVFLPDTVDVLPGLFHDPTPWDAILVRLKAVAAMPLRPEPPRGRIAHVTLRTAVSLCRNFWRGEGRTWKMETLEILSDEDDDLTVLDGECERFVVDTLGAAGFEFRLADLRRAWRDRSSVKATNPG